MTADAQPRERFTLREDRRRKLPFVIERQVADTDFLPGAVLWTTVGEVGAFTSREDARNFMIARSERLKRAGEQEAMTP